MRNMKKQFTYIVMGIAVLGAGAVAHAQTPIVPATISQVAATSSMATSTSVIGAKATKKAKLQEAVGRMENSLQVRIANLDDFAQRIQSRMAKMQTEGKDMTAANAKFAEAQKAIALAKTEMANLKKADAAMIASTKPATAFVNIKNKTAKNVVVRIKAAHAALVDVIVIMKGQGTSASATSTVR